MLYMSEKHFMCCWGSIGFPQTFWGSTEFPQTFENAQFFSNFLSAAKLLGFVMRALARSLQALGFLRKILLCAPVELCFSDTDRGYRPHTWTLLHGVRHASTVANRLIALDGPATTIYRSHALLFETWGWADCNMEVPRSSFVLMAIFLSTKRRCSHVIGAVAVVEAEQFFHTVLRAVSRVRRGVVWRRYVQFVFGNQFYLRFLVVHESSCTCLDAKIHSLPLCWASLAFATKKRWMIWCHCFCKTWTRIIFLHRNCGSVEVCRKYCGKRCTVEGANMCFLWR